MGSKDPKMILYSYYFSSASWRVRAVMYLKNIKYDTKEVKLLDQHQHSPDFLQVNPMHQVPSLTFDQEDGTPTHLTQSLAIIDYLEHRYPKPSIYPQDNILRAKSKAIADSIAAGIQPFQNLETLTCIHEPLGREPLSPIEKQKFASYWIEKKLGHLECLIKKTSGQYCVGDVVTIADVCLVPQMFNALRFKVDLTNYPTLRAIDERLRKLDMFYYSHPYKCVECPTTMTPEMEKWREENKR